MKLVADIIPEYLEAAAAGRYRIGQCKPKAPSTLKYETQYLRKQISLSIGKIPINAVNTSNIQEMIDRSIENNSPSSAIATLNVSRALLEFALMEGYITENAAMKVEAPKPNRRERVLSDLECKSVFAYLYELGTAGLTNNRSTALALLAIAATLQKRGAVSDMRKDEIDFARRVWVVPAARSHTKSAVYVPLSEFALEIISCGYAAGAFYYANTPYVFPSPWPASEGEEPISTRSMEGALKACVERTGLEDIKPHDFRDTAFQRINGMRLQIDQKVTAALMDGSPLGPTMSERNAMERWGSVLNGYATIA